MSQLASENNIKVILCSVLPAYDFPWRPGLNPKDKVISLNDLIQKHAQEKSFEYVDYFVINVSSPNTPDLRELQDKKPLTALIKAVQGKNKLKNKWKQPNVC